MFLKNSIKDTDLELFNAIQGEYLRQEQHIELIASENYTSYPVMEAQGSLLTNKYAEGYPNKRYYGGCEYVDIVESLAISRAQKLFQADYANVQPHSGSQANAAVYLALLNPGDTILGMKLDHGGHLTHGSKFNFSGKTFNAIQYGINTDTGLIDFNEVEDLAKKHQPKMIVAGFSAYSRTVNWQNFREIADKVGAYLLVDMAHVAGLVAANLYPSPVAIADVTTTTTHKTLRGPRGGLILAKNNPEIIRKLNSAVFPGIQGGPLMHVIAAKAVAFKEALTKDFLTYQKQVLDNASLFAEGLISKGFDVVSNGTDNHLFLLNLISRNISGKEADLALSKAYITVNCNTVPNDPRSAFETSGIRIGSPAITTRGFKSQEITMLIGWVANILNNPYNETITNNIRNEVLDLCSKFPVYQPYDNLEKTT